MVEPSILIPKVHADAPVFAILIPTNAPFELNDESKPKIINSVVLTVNIGLDPM